METKKKGGAYPLAMTAVMAAVIAAVAPFAIPVGPIPITLCTLAIYLSAYVLGWKRAAVATLVYILLGAVGLPVFNSFSGGLGVVAGPTGGYIIGYLPLAALSGLAVATGVLYAFGTAWYCLQSGSALGPALALCVVPFLPGDLAKMLVVVSLGPVLRGRLLRTGIHPEG